MRVSVIIPVYNAERYLTRAVASVLMQEEVTELLLVEDGSTDRSLKLSYKLAETDKRIVVLQHSGGENRGVAATRNLGILNASSEFVAFLDADDYYLPNRFKQTKQCFETDHTIDGIYEAVGLHDDPNNIKTFSLLKDIPYKYLFQSLSPIGTEGWFSCDGLTLQKSIFDQSGLFDEDLKTSEDTLLWLKMAALCKLVSGNISEAVAITERTIGSLSTDQKRMNKDQITMLYKLLAWLDSSDVEDAKEKSELTINTIIRLRYCSDTSLFYRTKSIVGLLYSIGRIDYSFLWRSKGIRRIIGSFIGYNKLLEANS